MFPDTEYILLITAAALDLLPPAAWLARCPADRAHNILFPMTQLLLPIARV